jgi:hypothetical protein
MTHPAATPTPTRCECESSECLHGDRSCGTISRSVRPYIVASFKQSLCVACALHAKTYCETNNYDFAGTAK